MADWRNQYGMHCLGIIRTLNWMHSSLSGLPEIVRAFKTFSGRRINQSRGAPGTSVWQRNYYEHVIWNDAALNRLRQYIAENPARWAEDPENPARQSHKGEKV